MNYLIVGLGNTGDKYKNTRHNIGFILLDALLKESGWTKSTSCDVLYSWSNEIEYIKPLTMMNLSGKAVLCAVKKHDLKSENVVVIHDDVDIAFGEWKISFGSSDGGHKGVKSIIGALGTKDFVRIRVGIAPTSLFGKKKKPISVERFVLGNLPKKKINEIKEMSGGIKEAIDMIVRGKKEEAMNKFN